MPMVRRGNTARLPGNECVGRKVGVTQGEDGSWSVLSVVSLGRFGISLCVCGIWLSGPNNVSRGRDVAGLVAVCSDTFFGTPANTNIIFALYFYQDFHHIQYYFCYI